MIYVCERLKKVQDFVMVFRLFDSDLIEGRLICCSNDLEFDKKAIHNVNVVGGKLTW